MGLWVTTTHGELLFFIMYFGLQDTKKKHMVNFYIMLVHNILPLRARLAAMGAGDGMCVPVGFLRTSGTSSKSVSASLTSGIASTPGWPRNCRPSLLIWSW